MGGRNLALQNLRYNFALESKLDYICMKGKESDQLTYFDNQPH